MTSPSEEILSFLSANERVISIRASTRLSYENCMSVFNQTYGHSDQATKEMLCRSINTLFRLMRYGERLELQLHNSECKFRLVKVKVISEQEEELENVDDFFASDPLVMPLFHLSPGPHHPTSNVASSSGIALSLPLTQPTPEVENVDDNGLRHLTPSSQQPRHSPLNALSLLTSTFQPSSSTSPVVTEQPSSSQPRLNQSRIRPTASTNPRPMSTSRLSPPAAAQSSLLLRSWRPTSPLADTSQPRVPCLRSGIRSATANPIANPTSSLADTYQPHLPRLRSSIRSAAANPIANPESSHQTRTFSSAASGPLVLPLSHLSPGPHHSTSNVASSSGIALSLALTQPPPAREGAITSLELRKRIEKINRDKRKKLFEFRKKKEELFKEEAGLVSLAKLAVLIRLILSELPLHDAPLVVEQQLIERGVNELVGIKVPFNNDENLSQLYSIMEAQMKQCSLVHDASTVYINSAEDNEEYVGNIFSELAELSANLKNLQSEKDNLKGQLNS